MADSSIRMPEALMAEVQKRAEAEDRNPEELVQEAVEQYLHRNELEEVLTFGKRHAKSRGLKPGDVARAVAEVRKER